MYHHYNPDCSVCESTADQQD